MKTLVVYYSKSGNTRRVAEEIAKALGAETEEIVEVGVKRTGILGFLRAGRGGMMREKSRIEAPKKKPGDFDLVFVGSPVWGWNLAPAVRSYLAAVALGQKPMALFCTMGQTARRRRSSRSASSRQDLEPSANLPSFSPNSRIPMHWRARSARGPRRWPHTSGRVGGPWLLRSARALTQDETGGGDRQHDEAEQPS